MGTLLGLGGGFILVPILLYAYRFPQPVAVGTSHLVIVLNAFSGAIAYDRQRKIDYNLALWMAAAAIPASWLAAMWIVPRFHSPWFLVIFAVVLVFAAYYVTWRSRLADSEESEPTPAAFWTAVALSFGTGLLAVSLGIGGGAFYVPILALIVGRPFHRATATSQFVLLLSSLVAAAVLTLKLQVNLHVAAWLGIGVILGAQLGALAASKMQAPALKKAFAVAVLLAAAKLAWDGVRQLTS